MGKGPSDNAASTSTNSNNSNDISKIVWTTAVTRKKQSNNDSQNINSKGSSWEAVTSLSTETALREDDIVGNKGNYTVEDSRRSDTTTTTTTTTTDSISDASTIQVTNSDVVHVLPSKGLHVYDNFITEDETIILLNEIDQHEIDFVWEGFERRRKVQRYTNITVDDLEAADGAYDDAKATTTTPSKNLPLMLQELVKRIKLQTGYTAKQIQIEDFPSNQLSKFVQTTKSTVSTFESTTICRACCNNKDSNDSYTTSKCNNNSNCCCCFVGQIALTVPLIEYINRPKIRSNDCWSLYTKDHYTGLRLNQGSLYVKSDEFLWQWRCRISSIAAAAAVSNEDDHNRRYDHRILLLKFSNLPPPKIAIDSDTITTTTPQLVPTQPNGSSSTTSENGRNKKGTSTTVVQRGGPDDVLASLPDTQDSRITGDMPPLQEILTVVITTSPIKSNPSTELLERTFETFPLGGYEFAYKCQKLIICDGCKTRTEKTTKRHVNYKQAMRNGIVTTDQAINYAEFKFRLKQLCKNAANPSTETSANSMKQRPLSPFVNTTVEELDSRMGYGYALRHALYNCVKTPYVIVIQHDRTFMRPTPILESVKAMWYNHKKIKYIGVSMRSNLLYRDIFLGKYGKHYMSDMSKAVIRPTQLALDSKLYGPNSHSTNNMQYSSEKLRENISNLIDTYKGSQQYADHIEWLASNKISGGSCISDAAEGTDATAGAADNDESIAQLSLTPTFFWYDNVHVCETSHYRDFIFHPSYKMVAPGGFVEDKVSPVIKKAVERFGLIEGHSRFGCYLLDDHSGMFFTGHLDGGAYITIKDKQAIVDAAERKKASKSDAIS